MSLKKAKTIAKAFLSELPVDEKWYQDRIAICESCEYNSDNVPEEKLSVLQRIRIDSMNRFCTACQCDIDRKCSVKTEECGLVKLTTPQAPKWDKLEIESTTNDGVAVENLSPEIAQISYNNNEYLFDFGLTDAATIEFQFKITRKRGMKVLSVSPSCGCTVPNIKSFNNKSATLSTKISTKDFKQVINERTMTVNYQDGSVIKNVNIRFRIVMNKPTK